MGALSNLRVLDMSRILAGPWAGQVLGDLGAEVIKIERPGTGDDTRSWGPPYLKDKHGLDTDAAYFLCANRNKKSVTADITKSEGQNIIRSLAEQSDILIENYKVGGLKQYGLDYESLKVSNPRLIYCSITGFGQTGPYAQRAGYDFLIQGMGGLMSITGRKEGEEGAGPQKVGVALTDILTGLYATIAILAAITDRNTTGLGQYIDMALLDVQVAALANQNMNYLTTNSAPGRMGNAHPNIVPYQDFPTADGDMIVAVGNDGQFARLCVALNHPEWSGDVRFESNQARVANRAILIPLLRMATVLRSTNDWIGVLEKVGVPCGPINTLQDVYADPQVQARNLRRELPHPLAGVVPTVANPINMSRTPPEYRSAPPTLGQHTREILTSSLRLSNAEVDRLAQLHVI